ncbi:MAG: hypothetical protein WC947_08910 [Elusimicrobiota bacterium]
MGVFIELKKINARIIIFFQGSIIHKIYLILSVILIIVLVFSIWKAFDNLFFGKYKTFGDKIVNTVYQSVERGETVIEIENELDLDYVLIVGGYDIPKKEILKSGLLDKKLVDKSAKKNPQEDGIYIHLIKNNNVLAVKGFKDNIAIEGKCKIAKLGNKIKFYVRKEMRKDMFGKLNYEYLIIYKIE